jgi:hypothetical protein
MKHYQHSSNSLSDMKEIKGFGILGSTTTTKNTSKAWQSMPCTSYSPNPLLQQTHIICSHTAATVLEDKLCLLATRSEMVTSAEATWDHIRGESGKKSRKRDPCTHCDEGINTAQFSMENTEDRESNLTTATEDVTSCSWHVPNEPCCSRGILYKTLITT